MHRCTATGLRHISPKRHVFVETGARELGFEMGAPQDVGRTPLNAADEPRSQYPPSRQIRGRTSPPCDGADASPRPVAAVMEVGVVPGDERCERYAKEHDKHGPRHADVGPVERALLLRRVHVVRFQRLDA